MIHDDPNPTAATPAKYSSGELPEDASPPAPDPGASAPANLPELPLPPRLQFDPSVPEDLRSPWGWMDLFLFIGFGFLGLLFAGGIVVGVAMFGFGVQVRDLSAPSASPAKSMIAVLSQGLWSGFVLLYFFALVRTKTESPFWRTMGWRALHLGGKTTSASALRCLGGGAILALIVSFAGKFLNERGDLPIEEMFRSRPAVILLMFFGILVAPLVEETMFRGFLYPIIARRFGVGASVAVTGVLFGAMHAQQLWGGWGQIGLLIGVGILLTWVRARTGTVAASYFMHLGYNSLLFLGFFAATGGLRHIPGAS
jgi:membrane protease YdiL (CAAX protease family)